MNCCSNSLNLSQGSAHSNKIISLYGCHNLTSRLIMRAYQSDSRVLCMHLMQQIINEVQVQCWGDNNTLMQTKAAARICT
jgi:hypothetical protein